MDLETAQRLIAGLLHDFPDANDKEILERGRRLLEARALPPADALLYRALCLERTAARLNVPSRGRGVDGQ